MFRTTLLALVAAALLVVPGQAATVRLEGEVGPGFKIEVEKAGKDLKTIKAGTYRIKIEDKSSIHNFHLVGPGLNKKTGVAFRGETTWRITLRPGRYTYKCDPHASSMRGSFRVTA